MRIGISCHPSAGGSGIIATELGIALAERGHQVHFVTQEPPFRLQGYYENLFVHQADTISYPLFKYPPYNLALLNKTNEVAQEHGIELWHAHYAIPHAVNALFAREMLPPERRFGLVTTLHGTDITLVGSDPSFYRITKFAMEQSCAVTAVSNWLRDETHREFDLEREVRTIYNFLDMRRFNGDSQPAPLPECSEKVIMHISNFRPVKRVTDVVRAFKKVLDRVPAKLIMVGEGPERMAAVGVARQLGISDHIRYMGNFQDIEALLGCADLVFQPSEHESFGLVPLEAMACGKPVLGTTSGGIVEVVEHGVTGVLTEVGDTDAMAQHAIEVLTNETLAKEMGERARARVRNDFDRDKIVSQYEALYEEVLALRRSQAC